MYCNAADAALADALENYPDQRFFPIAWHVDYWNPYGWVDPFSSPEFTARQHRFATTLQQSTVGTPQTLVNLVELSNYTASHIGSVMDQALETEVDTSVTLFLESEPGASPVVVNYLVDGAPTETELTVVLVERGLTSHPTAGENTGVDLTHENVARVFTTIEGDLLSGQIQLEVAPEVLLENCSIIGFVQNTTTLDYFGATAVDAI